MWSKEWSLWDGPSIRYHIFRHFRLPPTPTLLLFKISKNCPFRPAFPSFNLYMDGPFPNLNYLKLTPISIYLTYLDYTSCYLLNLFIST